MELTPAQHDTLTEMVNIGFNRAAGALSVLVSRRVSLKSPTLKVYRLDELGPANFPSSIDHEVTTIHQVFSGALSGNALLMMSSDSASSLVDLLTGGEGLARRMNASDREALVEVGNILLNAYLGTFGNLLKVHISFTVPHLRSDAINDIFSSMVVEKTEMHYVLMVSTEFQLENGSVGGYVILMMGLESLEALLAAIDRVQAEL